MRSIVRCMCTHIIFHIIHRYGSHTYREHVLRDFKADTRGSVHLDYHRWHNSGTDKRGWQRPKSTGGNGPSSSGCRALGAPLGPSKTTTTECITGVTERCLYQGWLLRSAGGNESNVISLSLGRMSKNTEQVELQGGTRSRALGVYLGVFSSYRKADALYMVKHCTQRVPPWHDYIITLEHSFPHVCRLYSPCWEQLQVQTGRKQPCPRVQWGR